MLVLCHVDHSKLKRHIGSTVDNQKEVTFTRKEIHMYLPPRLSNVDQLLISTIFFPTTVYVFEPLSC